MHLVIDGRCIHKHLGGIGVMARQLVRQMVKVPKGNRISLLIGKGNADVVGIPGLDAYEVQGAMIDERFEQLYLPDILVDLAADVYLNPTFAVPAIKTTAAQVAIIHDVVFEDHPEWVEPRLRDYLQRAARFAAQHADHIITVSDYSRTRVCDVYEVSAERVTRIYNGVDEGSFVRPRPEQTTEACAHFGLDRPFLLSLGTLEAKKGVQELIEAFALLAKKHPTVDLVLAGGAGGETRFDVDSLILDSGCADRIRRLGYIDERSKKPLLVACEALVYPSRYEGFGLPPLEAMALGKACVVHDGTSLPEVVGSAALRVDVTDRDAFADALFRALTDSALRARLTREGPLHVRKQFSWDRLAAQYLDVCQSLLVVA